MPRNPSKDPFYRELDERCAQRRNERVNDIIDNYPGRDKKKDPVNKEIQKECVTPKDFPNSYDKSQGNPSDKVSVQWDTSKDLKGNLERLKEKKDPVQPMEREYLHGEQWDTVKNSLNAMDKVACKDSEILNESNSQNTQEDKKTPVVLNVKGKDKSHSDNLSQTDIAVNTFFDTWDLKGSYIKAGYSQNMNSGSLNNAIDGMGRSSRFQGILLQRAQTHYQTVLLRVSKGKGSPAEKTAAKEILTRVEQFIKAHPRIRKGSKRPKARTNVIDDSDLDSFDGGGEQDNDIPWDSDEEARPPDQGEHGE